MMDSRVSMRCPVAPPMPGCSLVPASGSAFTYIRGTPNLLPASAFRAAAESAGASDG